MSLVVRLEKICLAFLIFIDLISRLAPFEMFPPSLWSDFHRFFLTGAHRHINFAAQARFPWQFFHREKIPPTSRHPQLLPPFSRGWLAFTWSAEGGWWKLPLGPVAKIALSRLGGRKINPCPKTCGSRRKNLRKTTNSHAHSFLLTRGKFHSGGWLWVVGGKLGRKNSYTQNRDSDSRGFSRISRNRHGENVHLGRPRHWEWRFWRDSAMFYLRFCSENSEGWVEKRRPMTIRARTTMMDGRREVRLVGGLVGEKLCDCEKIVPGITFATLGKVWIESTERWCEMKPTLFTNFCIIKFISYFARILNNFGHY